MATNRIGRLACLVLGLGACTPARMHVSQPGAASLPPVDPTWVRLYAAESPRPPRVIVGPMAVDGHGNALEAADVMRREAAAMGADAVIHVRLTKMHGFILSTGISGVAVRTVP
jgi:hypothetical protein